MASNRTATAARTAAHAAAAALRCRAQLAVPLFCRAQPRPRPRQHGHNPFSATSRAPSYSSSSSSSPPPSSIDEGSPAASSPPLMHKLKADLKAAMRARDAPRLSVLRAIMAAHLNASKTSSPVRTDAQLVALMRRLQKVVPKKVEGYLADSGVASLGAAQLRTLVEDAVKTAREAGGAGGNRSVVGEAMKRLAGALQGKDVDRKEVAKMVKELVG
ncbi:Aspartyl/glutamyl-tRNA amidotransferase subunit B-related protein [Moelleriella libera RCEF 2490]|uniref:Aspartyl/glutamyl-tRNA amidotransferase subunit B-related protein n=1 Tax=Moelleriella libera RCEF 2490 TaxID=1081109 RepID=A0A167X546_9HYPO|nr:Aspartyl/glutamyl-tRNA amidotransferase subunit B-related protein [Moelleriella libera RCEF 2490]